MKMIRFWKAFEKAFDAKAERFLWRHPILGLLCIFAGVPALVLAAVCAGTLVIAVPLGWLLGWL